ncbi:DUF1996 domain-containing protein [Paractinoplanes brasiliensis]|uniref:Uncharacterized protein DUF1996 n=1 Tax=Paractinoplanes brasiliensis TaxID=52695 RepID=A0A4R6JNR0_9ACTN|nr:DUF1996 domain-containing protein [Actinoplanes brasiliensis]TDO38030.1 uncharacterized protein DUF1996 [Actinoplanes brasiliensis]GID31121.1 hypothetical protein Abr02nite_61040 [Actinoplanes brasiliensis]
MSDPTEMFGRGVPQARHRRRPRRVAVVLLAGVAVMAVAGSAVAVSLVGGNAKDTPAPALAGASAAGPSAASPDVPNPGAGPSRKVTALPSPGATPVKPVAAPRAGWVPVDRAAWQKQVATYQARKVDPVPAGVGDLPEFRADCEFSHRRADDPIVFPGLPGASHMHSFHGNKGLDAGTTAGDLMKFTASTCKPAQDHSAYWVPTLYDNATGAPVETTGFRVYYRSLRRDSSDVMPMPNGLRLIAGDAKKKVPTPRGAQGQFYCAFYGPGDLDGVARSTNGNWPICGKPATLHFMLQFPDCWDGKHLDSPSHKDHVAYGDEKRCPSTHPVRIPAITFDIQYGVKGTRAGYYLSSDPQGKSASSMHGDAFVMWDADAMNKRTKNCVRERRTCDNDGYYS